MRSTCETSGRCQVSKRIPTSASPISSSACSIVETGESTSACDGWIGSSATGTPCRAPASAILRMPSITASRSSPGPVRKNTQLGSSSANRATDRQIDSTRASGSSGPGISGDGRIEPAAGRHAETREPALAQLPGHVVDTVELELEDPDRPCPAARYAASSSSNEAGNVVHSQIPMRTTQR